MLTKGVVLLRDNAWPHTTARTNALIKLFNWDIFDHPPYSTDLTPSDYHIFTKMKVWLATQCFHTNEELMDAVSNWLHNLVALFFDEGLQKLVSHTVSPYMWMATMCRSNAVMYVTVPHNKVLFSIL
jgi:hypothetical protein